jgi:hypothetical protein
LAGGFLTFIPGSVTWQAFRSRWRLAEFCDAAIGAATLSTLGGQPSWSPSTRTLPMSAGDNRIVK